MQDSLTDITIVSSWFEGLEMQGENKWEDDGRETWFEISKQPKIMEGMMEK